MRPVTQVTKFDLFLCGAILFIVVILALSK